MEKYITILDFVKNEVHILKFTEKKICRRISISE